MSKKKIILAAVVAIVAIALGWYFLYFTKTPVYSLNLAREAVEKHDVNAFKKHVDVDSIIGSGYDDVVAMQLEDPEIKNNPLKGLAEVMFQGLKPKIVPILSNEIYNAIANGGKMMKPRFVKQIIKNGEVVYNNPPQVIKEHIAKESTIKEITRILTEVVSEGLGKKAGSDKFLVAGKTGTAQMSKGALGYKAGGTNYLLSFAGFFPADKPRYSCIVCIQKTGLPASGGGMSGVVFHHIAEGIMAQDLKLNVQDARDKESILIPSAKTGNLLATDYVLNMLGFNVINGWGGAYPFGNPIWGTINQDGNKLIFKEEKINIVNLVPDVKGMGARDAVYLLEKHGIKTIVVGRGRVIEQSIAPNDKVQKGMKCTLRLG